MIDSSELVDRFVAMWNEPDPERRRQAVAELWDEDAEQILQPPQEVVAAARDISMQATFQVRGHDELEARVARAHEQFVAEGGNSFRAQDPGTRVGDVVKFRWEMVTGGGAVAAVGLDVFVLAPDGRIQVNYQFIEG